MRDYWTGKGLDLSVEEVKILSAFQAEQIKVHSELLKKYPDAVHMKSQIAHADKLTQLAASAFQEPIRVAVTGAAGSIGYALLARIASGAMFGNKTPVILQLLELPAAMNALKGVEMELRDSAFPLLHDIIITDVTEKAFEGVDYALLVGASPRKAGQERADLLLQNAEIFAIQGKALNKVAKKEKTRVGVVGNPANTNAMIAQRNAPSIPAENFMAMTRLDHNRALSQLSLKTGLPVTAFNGLVIWGNHSAMQFPDHSLATARLPAGKEVFVSELIQDASWFPKDFIPTVQKRGAAIIDARKASSAASAASSLVDMIHDWHFGTQGAQITSGAVYSNGEYGVEKGLFFSYPIIHPTGSVPNKPQWKISHVWKFNEEGQKRIKDNILELQQERDAVRKYL